MSQQKQVQLNEAGARAAATAFALSNSYAALKIARWIDKRPTKDELFETVMTLREVENRMAAIIKNVDADNDDAERALDAWIEQLNADLEELRSEIDGEMERKQQK